MTMMHIEYGGRWCKKPTIGIATLNCVSWSVPCEERGIPVMFGNFELEALERLTALSIQCWQVDVEDAKEAVRLVLHAGRLAVRRPPHALRDRRVEDALLAREKRR